jgi:heme exporter protein A
VLDEPFTNLDTASSAHVAQALGRHLEAGGLALIAAHQGLNLPERALRRLELT